MKLSTPPHLRTAKSLSVRSHLQVDGRYLLQGNKPRVDEKEVVVFVESHDLGHPLIIRKHHLREKKHIKLQKNNKRQR